MNRVYKIGLLHERVTKNPVEHASRRVRKPTTGPSS